MRIKPQINWEPIRLFTIVLPATKVQCRVCLECRLEEGDLLGQTLMFQCPHCHSIEQIYFPTEQEHEERRAKILHLQ